MEEDDVQISLPYADVCRVCCRVLTHVWLTGCAGGISVQTRVGLSLENSFVVGNVATRSHGGGAYVSVDSTLRVSGTTVENNAAGDRGGESATFCDLLTIINLFGTAHGEQVLGS
jgi:hypothetical protein